MNARLGQHLTLLGLCAMIFYALMLATGTLSLEVMPQFVVSAVIFLSSGRLMKRAARNLPQTERTEKKSRGGEEPDWAWLTLLLNWMGALMVVGIMAILLMKPIGFSLIDAITGAMKHQQYFAGDVP